MINGLWALMILSVTNGVLLLTSYISNNTFPHPLSEGEEAEYITRLNRGDQQARHILAEHNLRLVAHIVKKFEGSGEDTDDLISIGTIGLIKAIDTYCPNRGTRLATYAARCIENDILMSKGCCVKDKKNAAIARFFKGTNLICILIFVASVTRKNFLGHPF